MTNKTFTLYLAKPNVTNPEDIFTDTAKDKIRSGVQSYENSNFGDRAIAYIFQNPPTPPAWLSEVQKNFDGVATLQNKSSSGVIIFSIDDRWFATTFGYAWTFLNDAKLVSDFGLKVTVNTLADNEVNRIDRNHLGEGLKGVTQSPRTRDFQAFGISDYLDQVRRISGKSDSSSALAERLSGAMGLKLTKNMTLSDLPKEASEALSLYSNDAYKKKAFKLLDKVTPILDKDTIDILDGLVAQEIRSETTNFELTPPVWFDDDVVYYSFLGLRTKKYASLSLADYVKLAGNALKNASDDDILSKHGVRAELDDTNATKKSWPIKSCLVGSLTYSGILYAISEGEWFSLDDQFKQSVDDTFSTLKVPFPNDRQLPVIKKIYNGNKESFESELDYNERYANEFGYLCMDQRFLYLDGGKIEACDLLDIAGKTLIHVKKGSRSSSVLSHFFKQGANSAIQLRTTQESRVKLLEVVKKEHGQNHRDQLEKAIGNSFENWTVEYQIIDKPTANGKFMIPFFSRISLQEEARDLKSRTFMLPFGL